MLHRILTIHRIRTIHRIPTIIFILLSLRPYRYNHYLSSSTTILLRSLLRYRYHITTITTKISLPSHDKVSLPSLLRYRYHVTTITTMAYATMCTLVLRSNIYRPIPTKRPYDIATRNALPSLYITISTSISLPSLLLLRSLIPTTIPL